jgi:hypothetical protein
MLLLNYYYYLDFIYSFLTTLKIEALVSCEMLMLMHQPIRRHRLATGWTGRGSNPGGEEIFRTYPDQSWGPPSVQYNGSRVSFPGVKRSGRGVNHPSPFSAEVKERIEL